MISLSVGSQAARVRFEPTSLQEAETTKENFKDYLDKAGVKEALTRGLSQLLIALYRTPSAASTETLNFLKKAFGEGKLEPPDSDMQALRLECEELNTRVQVLEKENKVLKRRLAEVDVHHAEVHWDPLEPEQREPDEPQPSTSAEVHWGPSPPPPPPPAYEELGLEETEDPSSFTDPDPGTSFTDPTSFTDLEEEEEPEDLSTSFTAHWTPPEEPEPTVSATIPLQIQPPSPSHRDTSTSEPLEVEEEGDDKQTLV